MGVSYFDKTYDDGANWTNKAVSRITSYNVCYTKLLRNLILLDEATLYNSSHLFGFFSVFNTDAIKDIKLYKGGIPARFGGRVASSYNFV